MDKLRLFLATMVLALLAVAAAYALDALPKAPPVPRDNPMTPAKVELGKKLYFDPRLSSTGTVSCNTCHDVRKAGDDGLPVSVGVEGKKGTRSAPTVWNAAFLSVQFWDGRSPNLEDQAKGPIINPVEMGMPDHAAMLRKVTEIPAYVEEFRQVFGGDDPVTVDNVVRATAAYERTPLTPNSPFDRFKAGDKAALSAQAKRGMKLVETVGCITCHSGPVFAGPALPEGQGFYMKFPTMAGTPYDTTYRLSADPGRYEVTKNEDDRSMWRVAQWRNIARTAPYFHNGSVPALDEAVRVMARTQLGRDLKPDEVADIVAFLEALTGEFPVQTVPQLPGMEENDTTK